MCHSIKRRRPDLDGSDALKNVKAAILLIVGEKDDKEIIN
jgi:hypothetical protein